MQTEQLIISLIKDDLINSKLVNGLNQLGLCASDYHLHLSETIFSLMGIDETPDNDKLLDYYIQLSSAVQRVDLSDITGSDAVVEKLARTIHSELLQWKV
ncbi:hypothetical protein [Ohtaekwangia koreensis]|uniref:Uncharacterized protein n=1 Tax=Ohtaekwangia koreensis TaxID=688867 RepID=A0A1T5IP38_9BACT|nr:hypothetical protein [Ohtaekwangia koreensis]SKC40778.1 hypothetical protein SAMN05660236_0224 [Ohtaekwangia koreensis]